MSNYSEENITQENEESPFEEIKDDFQESEETFSEEENEEVLTTSQISKGIRRPSKFKSLSEKDLFRRTTSIFEQAKNVKIRLEYTNENNLIQPTQSDNTEYRINLKSPANKAVPKYTALNHELAHVSFDTFMGGTSKEHFNKKIKGLPTDYVYGSYAEELYDMAANVLEDEGQHYEDMRNDMD